MNLLSYVFGCNCNDVFRILYFEQFAAAPDVRTYVVYLSFAGSIGHSLNDKHAVASRKRSRQKKSGIGRFFI